MKNAIRKALMFIVTAGLVLPLGAIADDGHKDWIVIESVSQADEETPKRVKEKEDDEEAALLLPAVQKVRESAAKPGIEPDEIDAPKAQRGIEHEDIGVRANKPGGGMTGQSRRRGAAVTEDLSVTKELDKASPKLMQSNAGGRQYTVQQMMAKLQPRGAMRMAAQPANSSPADKVAAPPPDLAYEIADCGTPSSPMICCHHEAGDGSTCNMFKMLCENAGGTAQGDGTDATCSDWP